MRFLKGITGMLALAASIAFAPMSFAQTATIEVLTAGSSAQFGSFAVAAYQLAKSGTPTAYGHDTLKDGTCIDNGSGKPTTASTSCHAYIYDHSLMASRRDTSTQSCANLWLET